MKKIVNDNPNEIMKIIVGTYSLDKEREYETNEENIIIPQVKDKES